MELINCNVKIKAPSGGGRFSVQVAWPVTHDSDHAPTRNVIHSGEGEGAAKVTWGKMAKSCWVRFNLGHTDLSTYFHAWVSWVVGIGGGRGKEEGGGLMWVWSGLMMEEFWFYFKQSSDQIWEATHTCAGAEEHANKSYEQLETDIRLFSARYFISSNKHRRSWSVRHLLARN